MIAPRGSGLEHQAEKLKLGVENISQVASEAFCKRWLSLT